MDERIWAELGVQRLYSMWLATSQDSATNRISFDELHPVEQDRWVDFAAALRNYIRTPQS